MFKNLSLENFKGFQRLDNLEFKPITILCGTNSSGKSSILKSILLLKQTMNSQQLDSRLLLNGKMVKLGSFENIIYAHNTKEEIKFSLCFNFEDLQNVLKRSRIKAIVRDFFNIDLNKNSNGSIVYSFSFKLHQSDIILSQLIIEGNERSLKLNLDETNKYTLSCKNLYNLMDKNNKGITKKNIRVETVYNSSLIPNITIPLVNVKNSKNDNFVVKRSIEMMCHYSNIVLDYLLFQINYIGPLRKEPARRYIYEDEISSIGSRGENAAFIYAKEKDKNITSFVYNDVKNQFEKETYKFKTILNKWLKMMHIIDFDNKKRDEIIRLKVKSNSGINVDISDVGFGVSQILPILIEGLRMEQGQTLLLEQPEIHLHPKLQMQLTDFFIAMAKDNKNTIIETHSEHVINRLVRRSLENDEIANLINIYFINENSEVEKIKIDKTKGIANWPKNFFDQAADEQREILKLTCKNIMG